MSSIKEALSDFVVSLIPNPKSTRRRMDTRRLSPLFVIALFILVTISHQASYAGSFEAPGLEFVGWPYAIAMDLSILVTEYFTRWQTTRTWAWRAFALVTLGSGSMNVAYVKPWNLAGLDEVFAWIYAVLPTIIIIALGFLSSNVDKLATTQEKRWQSQEKDDFKCFCGKSFGSKASWNAHQRAHAHEVRENSGNRIDGLKYLKKKYSNAEVDYPSVTTIAEWLEK